MKLSIVIPVYNEEYRIKKTLYDIFEYLKLNKLENESEIVLVNDGSKDQSVSLINKIREDIPQIRLINNKVNQGKGAVVRQGVLESLGDWILFMDADNSTNIKELDKFIPYKDKYDVIIGSRDLPESKVIVSQNIIKRILGDLGNLWIQLLLIGGIKDTQCGFKLFRREVAIKVFKILSMKKWSFDIEILTLTKYYGYKIREVAVIWENDERSNVKWSDYVQVLIDTLIIKIRLIRGLYK